MKYITENRPSTISSVVITALSSLITHSDESCKFRIIVEISNENSRFFYLIAKGHMEYSYKLNTVATEIIAQKNQAFQLSTSILLLIVLLFITSRC